MSDTPFDERDLADARERIEAKKDAFAGGPEPGWEQMEEAAAAARVEASGSAEELGTSGAPESMPAATDMTAPEEVTASSAGPVGAAGEQPLGVGRQCTLCGTYNAFEAQACTNCGEPLGTPAPASAARPVTAPNAGE